MKLFSSLVVCAATLSSLAAIGCAGTPSGDEASESSEALGQAIDVPNPSGAYFASISANGTGCPAGSWAADISPDGQTFTVTFSAYEASVQPGQSIAVKDCALSINLKTPQGFSFSVSSFYYSGFTLLDQPGMSARQTAKYYFQGNPLPANEARSDMVGPYDSSYVFTDHVAITDQVWSPCGAQRTLNAQTRLALQNNPQRSGSGYVNTASVDGDLKMVFGLSWKQCNGGGSSSGGSSGWPGGGGGGGGGSSSGWPGGGGGGGSSSGWPGGGGGGGSSSGWPGGGGGGGSSSGWPGGGGGGGSSSGWPGGGSSGFPGGGGGMPCGVLHSGESLYKGQSLASCDGRTQFTHQADGQIVLSRDGMPVWRNGVVDPSSNVLTMQQDGHLVEWARNGRQLWFSQAAAGFGAFLIVQDGTAVIVDPNGSVLWAAGASFR